MSELISQLINVRNEYKEIEKKYIESIEEFCHNSIENTHITFKRNKMYVTFESFAMMTDKFMLKFCIEFGFLSPIIEYHNLGGVVIHEYKFIKIIG